LAPPDLPQRFGNYIVLERIGDGGMAEIFLAKMTGYSGFEKHVALKKILPRYSRHPSFARMLIHEAKLAARLQHFNVVQVLDLGEIDGQVYIAMEYVRGRDLSALLSNTYRRKERLPLGVSLCAAIELLTGLDYAHRLTDDDGQPLGLIHRDISPQNVLISYEGEVKLTDFGIARVITEENELKAPQNLHGKFGYMSPEQVDGLRMDQRSDIFGAGVVLHEMLTGQRLFRGKTPEETVELVRRCDIPLPSLVNPEVPPEIDRIVMRSLARDREARYQTVGAMLGDLSRVTNTLPQRASRRDIAVYMKRQFTQATGEAGNRRALSRGPTNSGGKLPIGHILIQLGATTADQVEIALAQQRANGGLLGEILVESGGTTEAALARALSTQSTIALAEASTLEGSAPSAELLVRFPGKAARKIGVLPVALEGDTVTFVVFDPYDAHGVLEARIILGVGEARLLVATRTQVMAAIDRWYGAASVEPPPDLAPEIPQVEAQAIIDRALVIIADPDQAVAEALAARVREEGYDALVATDGKAARALTRDESPQVVVLDAALPGIDGFNVLLDIRARAIDTAVFVTSTRKDDLQAKALELGADDFFPKPWSEELVIAKIRREVRARMRKSRPGAPTPQFKGVSGSLADMTVLDILQSIEVGRKSAVVVVNYEDGRAGEMQLRRGELRGCFSGAISGEPAFFLLARAGPGAFRIEYREPIGETNVAKPTTYLVLEALRRSDEHEASGFSAPVAPSAAVTEIGPPPNRSLLRSLVDDLDDRISSAPTNVMAPSARALGVKPASTPPYGVPPARTPARGVPAPMAAIDPMMPTPLIILGTPSEPPPQPPRLPSLPPSAAPITPPGGTFNPWGPRANTPVPGLLQRPASLADIPRARSSTGIGPSSAPPPPSGPSTPAQRAFARVALASVSPAGEPPSPPEPPAADPDEDETILMPVDS